MFYYENEYKSLGYNLICGVDEVGRGSLFGSVLSAAVIMPLDDDSIIEGINDSKKLTSKKRENLYDLILSKCIAYSVYSVDASIIDKINIYNATKLSMINAVNALSVTPDVLLIDAMKLNTRIKECSIIKGDSKSYSIAAASIIAKVVRDKMMDEYAKEYKNYGFEKNKGYGTKEHILAIEKYGATGEHRQTFAPLKYKDVYRQELF